MKWIKKKRKKQIDNPRYRTRVNNNWRSRRIERLQSEIVSVARRSHAITSTPGDKEAKRTGAEVHRRFRVVVETRARPCHRWSITGRANVNDRETRLRGEPWYWTSRTYNLFTCAVACDRAHSRRRPIASAAAKIARTGIPDLHAIARQLPSTSGFNESGRQVATASCQSVRNNRVSHTRRSCCTWSRSKFKQCCTSIDRRTSDGPLDIRCEFSVSSRLKSFRHSR